MKIVNSDISADTHVMSKKSESIIEQSRVTGRFKFGSAISVTESVVEGSGRIFGRLLVYNSRLRGNGQVLSASSYSEIRNSEIDGVIGMRCSRVSLTNVRATNGIATREKATVLLNNVRIEGGISDVEYLNAGNIRGIGSLICRRYHSNAVDLVFEGTCELDLNIAAVYDYSTGKTTGTTLVVSDGGISLPGYTVSVPHGSHINVFGRVIRKPEELFYAILAQNPEIKNQEQVRITPPGRR